MSTASDPSRALRDALQDDSRVTVFVGAGASKEPPSSLPLAIELKGALLEGVWASSSASERSPAAKASVLSLATRSPLEFILQTIRQVVTSDRFVGIFDCFRNTAPNRCHHALAALAQHGHISDIVTTNFDTNIEAALAAAGVHHHVAATLADFEALVVDPPGGPRYHEARAIFSPALSAYRLDDLKVVAWPEAHASEERPVTVAKIHGSVESHASLVATLDGVTKGLPLAVCSLLAPMLLKSTVVVVGWSDADVDITPLMRVPSSRPTFWANHDPAGPVPSHIADLVQDRSEAAHVLDVDTAAWLASLAQEITGEDVPVVDPGGGVPWRDHIDAWCFKLDRHERDTIIATLARRVGLFDEALGIARSVAESKTTRFAVRAVAAITGARVYLDRGERLAAASLLGTTRKGQPIDETSCRMMLEEARCLAFTTREHKHFKLVEAVSIWAMEHGNRELAAVCAAHNAGTSLSSGRTFDAIEGIESIELAMVGAGSFDDIVSFLLLLSGIRVELGQWDKATAHLDRAREMTSILGDDVQLVSIANAQGVTLARRGRRLEARRYFNEAAVLAEQLGIPLELGLATMNLGMSHWQDDPQANHALALQLATQAERILVPLELPTYTRLVQGNIKRIQGC